MKSITLLLFIAVIVSFTLTPINAMTNVILTFDDGWEDHYAAVQKLDEHGFKGTFYINSGRVGKSQRLTLQQLYEISDRGHEIAGHTQTHFKLLNQPYETQYEQICDDRKQLLEWGFNVTSFAYPYGADTVESFGILAECGYNSARDSGGIRTNTSCGNCPTVESSPPRNPLQMRSISYRTEMGVEELKDFVIQSTTRPTNEDPDGALIIVFHEYGYYPDKTASITPEEMETFLTWLSTQPEVVVKTVHDFVGGEVQPIFTPDLMVNDTKYKQGSPFIAITLDDGTLDHINAAQILEDNGFRGTFFLNTDNIGKEGFLSKENLIDLNNAGHELGAHTKSGPHLLELSIEEITAEICDNKKIIDRWMRQRGGKDSGDGEDIATSIAWPYGESNSTIERIASECGLLRGRDVGGIKVPTSCLSCPSAVELPPQDPMNLRSFIVKSYHSLGELIWQVLRAEEEYTTNPSLGESVLIFTFHQVCDGCAFSPEEFENFVRWLKPRQYRGTSIKLLKNLI